MNNQKVKNHLSQLVPPKVSCRCGTTSPPKATIPIPSTHAILEAELYIWKNSSVNHVRGNPLCFLKRQLTLQGEEYTSTNLSQVKEFSLFAFFLFGLFWFVLFKEMVQGLSPHIMCPLQQSCCKIFPSVSFNVGVRTQKTNSVEMSHSFKISLLHVCFWDVAPAFSDKRNVSLLLALQSQIQCRKQSWPQAILMHQQQHCHLICKHRTIMMGKNRRGSLAIRFHLVHEELSVGKNIYWF